MPVADSQAVPTTVEVASTSLTAAGAELVAAGFTRDDDYTLESSAQQALQHVGLDAFALLDRAGAKGSAGETVTHEVFGDGPLQRVVLVGLGGQSRRDFRRAGAAVARAAGAGRRLATSVAAHADDDATDAFVEGLVLGAFGFDRKTDKQIPCHPLVVILTDLPRRALTARRRVVERACARAGASWQARTFALTPSNEKSPVTLADWSAQTARSGGLDMDVWDEKRLRAEGFGGILAVGSGSKDESRFIRLDYTPKRSSRHTPRVVLVGKGITFDSGGLSIKPRDAMMTMKRDMTGAGVVIAVMGALAELEVPIAVTGLVASAENAVGAASMRPGDVITHYGGRTSEVGNTDAEGRLVLADGLAYAADSIAADAVVDIATLTGAAKVALGTSLGAVFANRDSLADALTAAGQAAGEPVWRLPLSEEYENLLDNTFADATNAAGSPGSITAALYLQHFAGSVPWAHLDIAGVGDSPKDAFEYTQGATGFGARLLLRFLGDFTRT